MCSERETRNDLSSLSWGGGIALVAGLWIATLSKEWTPPARG